MIIALGGNDVAPANSAQALGITEQWQRTASSLKRIAQIVKDYPEKLFLIVHGNGPQVGNVLLRSEYSSKYLPTLPLDVCVANTQGAMGYMLEQLANEFLINGVKKKIATILTRVSVEKNDPDFLAPSKFIGPGYSEKKAKQRADLNNWQVKFYKNDEDKKAIWRRVVSSPKPQSILELDTIVDNLKPNMVPIVLGGGGIPVYRVEPKIQYGQEIYECNYGINYRRPVRPENKPLNIRSGVEAVVDKDLSAALLGSELIKSFEQNRESLDVELVIFTGIDGVKINFQKDNQQDIGQLTLSELKQLVRDYPQDFPKGSMGPKVQAAINLLESGGKQVFITSIDSHLEAFAGNAGTRITR